MDVDTYAEFYKVHQENAELKALLTELINGLSEEENNNDTENDDETEEEQEGTVKIESNVKGGR